MRNRTSSHTTLFFVLGSIRFIQQHIATGCVFIHTRSELKLMVFHLCKEGKGFSEIRKPTQWERNGNTTKLSLLISSSFVPLSSHFSVVHHAQCVLVQLFNGRLATKISKRWFCFVSTVSTRSDLCSPSPACGSWTLDVK